MRYVINIKSPDTLLGERNHGKSEDRPRVRETEEPAKLMRVDEIKTGIKMDDEASAAVRNRRTRRRHSEVTRPSACDARVRGE